jgi:hypothetical protein
MSSEKGTVLHYSNSGRQPCDSLRKPHTSNTSHDETRTLNTYTNSPQTSNTYTQEPPRSSFNPHRAPNSTRNSHNSQHSLRQSTHDYDPESHTNPIPVSSTLKNHFIAASGEFVGTFMFLFFGFATHLMAISNVQTDGIPASGTSSQTVIFISLGYGFSLLVCAWVWYRISGGLFNPAVRSHLSLVPFFVTY